MTHQLAPPNKTEPGLDNLPKPTFHRVLIEPFEEKVRVDIPNFIIPEGIKDKPTQGRIVALGPGRRTPEGVRVPMEFSVGQMVVYNRFSGAEVSFMRKIYLLVPEDEIICVL